MCKLCQMKFTTASLMESHIEGTHVKCTVCQEYFKDQIQLKEHSPCINVKEKPSDANKEKSPFLAPAAKTEIDAINEALPDPTHELVRV